MMNKKDKSYMKIFNSEYEILTQNIETTFIALTILYNKNKLIAKRNGLNVPYEPELENINIGITEKQMDKYINYLLLSQQIKVNF